MASANRTAVRGQAVRRAPASSNGHGNVIEELDNAQVYNASEIAFASGRDNPVVDLLKSKLAALKEGQAFGPLPAAMITETDGANGKVRRVQGENSVKKWATANGMEFVKKRDTEGQFYYIRIAPTQTGAPAVRARK